MKAQHESLVRKIRDLEGMLRIAAEQARQIGIELRTDTDIPADISFAYDEKVRHKFHSMVITLIHLGCEIKYLPEYSPALMDAIKTHVAQDKAYGEYLEGLKTEDEYRKFSEAYLAAFNSLSPKELVQFNDMTFADMEAVLADCQQ